MSDPLEWCPFGPSLPKRVGDARSVAIELLPQRPILSLRVWSGAWDEVPAFAATAGVTLPVAMNTMEPGSPRAARVAPDEWLIMDISDPPSLLGKLEAVLPGVPHIAADIGASIASVSLLGSGARDVLMSGCPLDLGRFTPGSCARTLLGKLPVLLDHRAAYHYEVHVDVSVGRHAAAWLHDAAAPLLERSLE